MKYLFIVSMLSLFFAGCSPKNETPTQTARRQLFADFPELGTDTSYRFIRKVFNGKNNFSISLYQSEKSESQFILARRNGNVAAVPLLLNSYNHFWNFTNTRPEKPERTFKNQLYKCIRQLGLDDTLYGQRRFMHELFISVLNYEYLYEPDSTYDQVMPMSCDTPFGGDCSERFARDFAEMKRIIHKFPSSIVGLNAAFFDKRTNRIFLLDYKDEDWQSCLSDIQLHVFLHECPTRCFEL